MPEPKSEPRTRLRQLLERPEARPRVRGAVVSLLAVTIVSIGTFGLFLIWHLVRRGRLIRESQPPPRAVRLPDRAPPADPTPEAEPSP
jgi:hypothetical protein